MADGRHIKERFRLFLIVTWSRLQRNLEEEAELHSETGYGTNMANFKIQYDGWLPFFLKLYFYISAAILPISLNLVCIPDMRISIRRMVSDGH